MNVRQRLQRLNTMCAHQAQRKRLCPPWPYSFVEARTITQTAADILARYVPEPCGSPPLSEEQRAALEADLRAAGQSAAVAWYTCAIVDL